MLSRKSISTTPFIVTFIIAIFLTLQFGVFITAREYFGFRMESKRMQEAFVSEQKEEIRREVEDLFSLIAYQASTTERRLRKEIRDRTCEAHAVMTRLHEEHAEQLSDADLKAVIKNALRDIRFNGDRGYYFATRLDGTEELFADKPELEGVNLLDLEDTQGKQVIREMIAIDASTRSGNLNIRYRDNGSGMTEDTLKKIFEPFFTTRRNRGGTGLGMHIVFNLVSRTLGGTITAESRPGDGTTFSIRIPLKRTGENALSPPATGNGAKDTP